VTRVRIPQQPNLGDRTVHQLRVTDAGRHFDLDAAEQRAGGRLLGDDVSTNLDSEVELRRAFGPAASCWRLVGLHR
jgi:hypothetical protein